MSSLSVTPYIVANSGDVLAEIAVFDGVRQPAMVP